MMASWTPPDESLPTPGGGGEYFVTADWGFRRPLQILVAKFDPTPGKPDRGIWKLAYWPHRLIPRDVVKAWMPAPEPYGPAPALETTEARS